LAALPARARLLLFDETALRLWPPLRAAWARVGQQAAVPVSGRNAQRSLYCALNLRSGRRITLGRPRQRQGDFQAFLRRLRRGAGAHDPLYLVLDHHSSHKAAASLRLAQELRIELVWLPKQCPNLNPVEHLWRELKGRLAANRQFDTIDDELRDAEAWLQDLTPPETFRKAGLCSPTFWLHKLYENIRQST
jgi:transposase